LVSKKNILATAYCEFWGTEYHDSIYLWEGAKHQVPLSQWDKVAATTLENVFSTKEKICLAHEYCKKIYYKLLPLLAVKLNEIHQLNYPVSFWETVCGRWFFEYICLVYDKYVCLSKLDLEHTSIKTLDKDSFYTPKGFNDALRCFTSDFGVQQLVSHYYYLFSHKKFPSISKKYRFAETFREKWSLGHFWYLAKQSARNLIKNILPKKKCEIAFVKTRIHEELIRFLVSESRGKIQSFALPKIKFFTKDVNYKKRKKILEIETKKDTFEFFLVQTLYYAVPREVVEQFYDYYPAFLKDIKTKQFTQIVSEIWIGHFPTAIYVAITQTMGKKLMFPQHGAFTQCHNANMEWFQFSVADVYITTGWVSNFPKAVTGGFVCRNITTYKFETWKKDILYISPAWFLYTRRFEDTAIVNSFAIRKLRRAMDIIDSIPDSLITYFVLRPRRISCQWDAEHIWEIEKKPIRIDNFNQNLLVSISNAKIVIIDQTSTCLAEILATGAPFLIVQNPQIDLLSDEWEGMFDELIKVGVAHTSAHSLMSQLVQVYDNIEQWWNSNHVREAIAQFKATTIDDPMKVTDYFLSCVNQ